MILILTERRDAHADVVIDRLKAISVPFFRLETADFPRSLQGSITFDNPECKILIKNALGHCIDLREVDVVWNRRPKPPYTDETAPKFERDFVHKESLHWMNGFNHIISDRFWINPLEANKRASYKPFQL